MSPTASPSRPAVTPAGGLARGILEAVEQGDLSRLEAGLATVEAWRATTRTPVSAIEEMELLEAVAGEMRRSLRRFERRFSPRLEGAGVHLRLLRHLAAAPH